ncbi:MAG: hypothetical protein CTY12_09130, partial [Methylotenera sp.]
MIKNLLRIVVLTTCTVFATHAFAFGGLLEKLNDAIVGGIVGITNPDIKSPPQKDRLLNVVDATKLKTPNTEKTILGSKAYKLAIVKSVNVDEQIKAYQAHVDRRSKGIKDYATSPQPFLDEVNSFVPGNLYFDKAVGMIKAKFNGVTNASNVQEAFDQGADYVAILDIKLENTDLSSKTEPGPLTERNVADLSVLFIDKNYEASPDIEVKNTSTETYQPIKPDSNIRNSLDIIKRARDKTFTEFEAKLNKLVVAELDDPPVKGITLSLDDDKPKSKGKKKK